MNVRALVLLAACLSSACGITSHLAPEEPLMTLDEAERAQLCRFTSDLVAHECLGLRVTDYDACTADPPWTGCEGDVAAWESCVAGWQEQGCDAPCDAYCAP
ncbi:MAG: hypothetical protein RLP09_42420 [Sandaracinaceae bacterium]